MRRWVAEETCKVSSVFIFWFPTLLLNIEIVLFHCVERRWEWCKSYV